MKAPAPHGLRAGASTVARRPTEAGRRIQRKIGGQRKLRLMYEANPMSWLVEQAGGAATNGQQRILEVQPTQLHERVSVILGSKNEVELVTQYHQERHGSDPVNGS